MAQLTEEDIEKKLKILFKGIKKRCTNKNEPTYKWYGSKGVCVEWSSSQEFYESMREGYKPGLTIDRIDPTKNYSSENCRWVPLSEQNNNKRNTVWYEINGERKTQRDWIKESGLNSSTVRQRIYCYGWDPEKALSTPLLRKRKRG